VLQSTGTTAAWDSTPQVQGLNVRDISVPNIYFRPNAGNEWNIDAGVTADQFRVRNTTDGTTPLAIQADRVRIGSRFLEVTTYPGTNQALVRLTATGGHIYDLFADAVGALYITDATTGRAKIGLGSDGLIRLELNNDGLRVVYIGGVDSGGAGYRALITPNNPG